jgi:superfamily II DNA helicase RecQ
MTTCVSTCPFAKCTSLVSSVPEDSCAILAKLLPVMHSYFRHESFRPGQLEAILPVMHGYDVLVKMPTGGGKTLCMFLPPLATSYTAIAVVISPLVALVEQQVRIACRQELVALLSALHSIILLRISCVYP